MQLPGANWLAARIFVLAACSVEDRRKGKKNTTRSNAATSLLRTMDLGGEGQRDGHLIGL